MAFKPLSRTTLLASKPRCTFKPIFPSLSHISRRTIVGPLGPPPASRTQPQSPSSSPDSSSQTSPPPPRRPGPPNTLESFKSSPLTSDRLDLVTRMRNSSPRPPTSAELFAKGKADVDQQNLNAAIEKQNTRRWRAGDVYAPHDLSSVEMMKWKHKRMVKGDAFEALNLDPRSEYKNYSIMWEYVTRMGRIKHSRETGLSNVNQRRLAKAVRRSVGMGLMPSVHKHPEMLEADAVSHAVFMARPSGQQGKNVPKTYRGS